ncbi:MAG: Flp pilus assembly protein CpaB [Henriciella sp.]|uniref:Flp pilus assembly protein CpaB n=1 Tax=Henriciella sp. TaxID=1968823 RepID=UPI00260489A1|nr:Flp pilus assembly protein CpaB [Henriciella sp.]
MQISPVITLLLSIAFGAAALLGARLWLSSSSQPEAPRAVEAAAPAMEPVLVASRDIPRGVSVSADWFAVEERPVSSLPPGHFTSADALEQSGDNRRTLIDIAAGQALSEAMLLAPGMRASLSAKIQPGSRAFTIRTSAVSGVGGFVLPGDHVDVIFTEDAAPESKVLKLVSKVLLQNVEVLGVDLNDDMTGEQAGVFETATLAVTLDQAQKLSVASQTGTLSLALRGSADEAFEQAEAVSLREEETPKQVAYTAPRRFAPRKPSSSTIEVVLGERMSEHDVPVSQ